MDVDLSMGFGKAVHIGRLVGAEVPFIVPMDHGLTSGPVSGIASASDVARNARDVAGYATGVVVHSGMARFLDPLACPPLIVQTMGMPQVGTKLRHRQRVTDVKHAVRLAADAVAVQADFLRGEQSVSDSVEVISAAEQWDLPVLLMISGNSWEGVDSLEECVRWATELGADLIKVDPGSLRTREPLALQSLDVPVFMAGGSGNSDLTLATEWAARSGFTGLCIGRGVFRARDPLAMLRGLSEAFQRSRKLSATGG